MTQPRSVPIGDRIVGRGAPCLVVAEIGVNHNGDVELARQLVDAAAAAGADAVKLQTFRADAVASPSAVKAAYQLETTGSGESQLEMLSRLELSPDDHRLIASRAAERGLLFLSTPFDAESAALLDDLDVAAFKVASPDLTNLPFVEHLARMGRPLILSTGMAEIGEIDEAVAAVRAAGNDELILLQCVSSYPAPVDEQNLRTIPTMAARWNVPVGFSDHTVGAAAALAAVALGAALLEKHFTLDRSLEGPDHRASTEPDAFAELVAGVRDVERALGDGVKRPTPAEAANRELVRRSLAAAADLPAGTVLEPAMLVSLRPGTGIPPTRSRDVIGRRVNRDVARGELLSLDDFA
jgi:N-acetylneuraminate synthase/N,N'-diacetyllegionaminate synthase